jgi:hypothetical protein
MATDIFPGARLVQLVEWGFPQRSLRPTPPATKGFGVVHITGNPGTPIATAIGEVSWRLNDPANQNSATFFVNRDGSVVQALGDPLHMDPWSNGDVNRPDTGNPRIAALLRDGVNANERTILSIENVGNEGTVGGLTPAQVETNARIFAHYFPKAGVEITRQSVIGHYQLNSVTRPNCPQRDKSVIDRIVARARAIAYPAPAPTPPQEEDMNARPPRFWRKAGRVAIPAGQKFNLFQYEGENADGSPKLRRFNGVKWSEATGAEVIGVLGFADTTRIGDGWLMSPYVYIPGVGWRTMVCWSSDPLPPPVVTWDLATDDGITQETVDRARKAGRTEGADAVLEAAKKAGAPYGAT